MVASSLISTCLHPGSGIVERLDFYVQTNVQGDITQFSMTTHLRHAEPHVAVRLVLVEVKLELRCRIRVEVEHLVLSRFAAGLDLAVVFPVRVYFQRTGVLLAVVEGDFHVHEVLGFL